MKYFIEAHSKVTYVAFNARKAQISRIEAELNRNAPIRGGVKVWPSMRPATNGEQYSYYARVANSIDCTVCDEIFEERKIEPNFHSDSNADMSARLFQYERIIKTQYLKIQLSEIKSRILVECEGVELGKLPILNDEMMEALLIERPTNKAEFCSSIPESLRTCTDTSQAKKYLDEILELFRFIKEIDPLDVDIEPGLIH